MAAGKFDIQELERRMRGALDSLKKEFAGLRTGRASVHFLDPVVVNVYGARMPINQVATVSTPDARTISVQVWDRGQVSAVEKAIREANLGLNPATEVGLQVTSKVIQVVGGRGAYKDFPAERALRDLRTSTLMPPTVEKMLETIGKRALGIQEGMFRLGDSRQ